MSVRLLGLVTLACLMVSCNEGPEIETPTYQFGLFPKVGHTGSNPTTQFKMLYATRGKNPTWSVADPNIATIAPSAAPKVDKADVDDLSFALVTTKAPGETTVSVNVAGTTLRAKLVVKAYSNEQVALGKTRYEAADADPTRKPCAECHQKAGGVDHSPLKMAGFDDPIILGVIQQATYPNSVTGGSTTSAFAPSGPLSFKEHKWNLKDDEKDAILAHLRSLPLGGL